MNSNNDVLRIAIKNELFGKPDFDEINKAKEYFTQCLVKKIKIKNINTSLINKSKRNGTIELGYNRKNILDKLFRKVNGLKVLVLYSDPAYDKILSESSLNMVDNIFIPMDTNIVDIMESIESYMVNNILVIDPILSLRANEIQLAMPNYNLFSFTEHITDDIIKEIQEHNNVTE